MQATKSQYVGVWEDGDFKGGQWVLQDNTVYESKDDTVSTPKAYAQKNYRSGVFHEIKLTNDLETYPIWDGAASKLPDLTPVAPEEVA